jgi:diguanylate cyclase (GGDEF)-like protein
VGLRVHRSALRARARDVLAEAPDHYDLLDRRLIGRLAGFLYCCAGIIALALLALDPPTEEIGGAGWLPALAMIAAAFGFGFAMVVNRRILGPTLLLLIGLSGPLMLGLLQWLAGSEAAYVQIIVLSVVWCGMVLPGPRLALVLVADSAMIFAPAAIGHWDGALLPERLATLGLAWVIGAVSLVYAAHQRGMRRWLWAERRAADELARVDALTGLGNRRALDEALPALVARAQRTGGPLAALIGDLDRFKLINDVHGHHAGDALLRGVAAVLRDVVRTPDACFRWGGDEFVILLADAGEAQAREIGARVAAAVAERCTAPDGTRVTLSLGAAEHAEGRTGAELLSAADADLIGVKVR